METPEWKRFTKDWESLYGNGEDEKDELKLEERPPRKFCTKSEYRGQWSQLGMHGHGMYRFPHGVVYEGTFVDGQFSGIGTYYYPRGQMIKGTWEGAKLVTFADGLMFSEGCWDYCSRSDRRYLVTQNDGFKPTPYERCTSGRERSIPDGWYDVGDGFYDPRTKCVLSAKDLSTVIRLPTATEEKWILENCRKSRDEPVGYRPDLYETWTTGVKKLDRGGEKDAQATDPDRKDKVWPPCV